MSIYSTHLPTLLVICLRAFVVLFAASNAFGTSQAAYVYTFSGQIPSDIHPMFETHPSITPGETWVATFIVSESTPNHSDSPTHGTYEGAVLSGELKFSGGYVSPFNFAQLSVNVINDPAFDRIYVSGFNPVRSGSLLFQAVSDQNPLSSTNLPVPGTHFLPSPRPIYDGYTQLLYSDRSGEVAYYSILSNNVSFSASIPEPTSLTLASLLGGSLVLACRCRR